MSGRAGKRSGIAVGEVSGNGTTVVACTCVLEVHFTGGGITIVETMVRSFLQTTHELKSLAVGVEVAHVLSVSVSISRCAESLSIVVDDHGTIDNLITSVLIDIGYDIVMIAVAVPRTGTVVTLPTPFYRQVMCPRIHL